ncbi:hypothetical protein ACNPM2_04130 [Stenotrophomonas geniculata]|jgi:hypothetical protein|uniref:Transmembrane protein n=1 Tax=Stenotrophomonas geniculata TaxID=86188 RepID=A0AAP5C4D7_9GAMM|nr:hypothetical protein [Stenotrophomonas geniculata]MDP4307498.1 hypothetical protein [Stenotrophomonas geniculata]MDP9619796.1 hypothetical protein [Stenotrophomonas maltophilia]MDQ7950889.1 hypothetical protein [Stenotrophomonas geniculata]
MPSTLETVLKTVGIIVLAALPLVILWFTLRRMSAHARSAFGSGLRLNSPRRISGTSMTLVMVDGKEDREHYFFDTESFYLRRGPVPTAVPLSQITSVTRTSDVIYARYVWQVCFSKASGRKCVTFTNNLSLFNRDFLLFLEAVRKANPLATVERASVIF